MLKDSIRRRIRGAIGLVIALQPAGSGATNPILSSGGVAKTRQEVTGNRDRSGEAERTAF